jgi:hypothetical protein
MLHRLGSLLAAASVVAAPLLVAAPAQADTPTCVSRSEFRSISKGWDIKRVHRTLDIAGKQSFYFPAFPELGIPAEQTREYRTCGSRWGAVSIDYKKAGGSWKLKSKMAFWG